MAVGATGVVSQIPQKLTRPSDPHPALDLELLDLALLDLALLDLALLDLELKERSCARCRGWAS